MSKEQPEWISAKDMREMLDIKPRTELEWRKRYNLQISQLGIKVYYDKNEILKVMTANSTYSKLLKAS